MEQGTETSVGVWSVPECPFRIEYSKRVLDDIRLAITDAFFSLPRGGAEIGGILLGKFESDLLTITDYEALDCEHAMGPSFTLSPRDQTRLAEIIGKAARNASHKQPVGWYHSHTRSEIFLSEADQDLHRRYFPSPWQVALVMKPHTFEPTRAGFFFRKTDGSIHAEAAYQEFTLKPLPLKPSTGAPGPTPVPSRTHQDDASNRAPVVAFPAQLSQLPTSEPPPAVPDRPKGRVPITREIPAATTFAGDTADLTDAPHFTDARSDSSARSIRILGVLALAIVTVGVAYQTRSHWLPGVVGTVRPLLSKDSDPYLSLAVTDDKGQLKIEWDRSASAVRNAVDASLQIRDGKNPPRLVPMDGVHLATGTFAYARESESVDITLVVFLPDGQQVREQTSFLGRLPGAKTPADESQVRKERDALKEQTDQLQKDLNSQANKTRKLEKDLKEMRDQMQKKTTGQE
jgi:proteasome lid subunit RPN8/RPN11